MALHDLSAVQLLAAFARKELSPVEVMRAVLERVEALEPKVRATYLFAPERALAEARASEARWLKGEPLGALDGVPATVKENIATRGEPKPVGTAATDLEPAARRRAARGAAKRSGRDHHRQDHDAGLRHAFFGPLQLSSAHPQPLESSAQSWRLVGRRGRRGGGGLRPAACRHRHRRVGAFARWLVRRLWPETQRRAHSHRPALHRPRRWADDAQRARRFVDDGDARQARRARLHELEARALDWPQRPANLRGLSIGLLTEVGCGWKPEPQVRAAVERAARDFETGGRFCRAARAVPHPGEFSTASIGFGARAR